MANVRWRGDGGWRWLGGQEFVCAVQRMVSFGDLLLLEIDALRFALRRLLANRNGFTFLVETEFLRVVDGRSELKPAVFQCFVEIAVFVKGFLFGGRKEREKKG